MACGSVCTIASSSRWDNVRITVPTRPSGHPSVWMASSPDPGAQVRAVRSSTKRPVPRSCPTAYLHAWSAGGCSCVTPAGKGSASSPTRRRQWVASSADSEGVSSLGSIVRMAARRALRIGIGASADFRMAASTAASSPAWSVPGRYHAPSASSARSTGGSTGGTVVRAGWQRLGSAGGGASRVR